MLQRLKENQALQVELKSNWVSLRSRYQKYVSERGSPFELIG